MRNTERDAEICRAYAAGDTLQECADRYGIRRQRVSQIIKKAGVVKNERPASDRDEFLGIQVSDEAKEALRAEAKRRRTSVSKLSAHGLAKMLVEMGYTDVTIEELPEVKA